MARRMSEAASACVSREISKHCHKKRGRCKGKRERAQAIAIGFSICKREGYKVPARR